ncbi:GNAT family N-acetyltransferase [Paenibacillus apiarius]|uniref:GNAT family N-acetyltransferase n=1 Tax=Paenibacillus apiarius TaxID=46240 RepID=UPI00197E2785|nr:GNAT family protein [Paenibacillus apiarius]MBN3526741.1 GNAT family N-acetyltransferase [Paenibacillus apiarius]
MKSFPILETDRLRLRQLRAEDAQELYHYFSQDEVTQYYDLESFVEMRQAEELIANWNRRYEEQQGIRWGITYKPDDVIIGTCGFHNWFKDHRKAEIGYELTPEYWRQGIMTEAIAQVMKFGFEEMGLHRIEAFIDPDNISSRKLLEKAGLREEGRLRECFYEKGQFVDAVIFSILKREFS